jgi:uncharacterized pyridoxal phosphate-dependent enzyme
MTKGAFSMNLHEKYGLTKILNARGTYTPLGVSRSSLEVGCSVSEALTQFFLIDELQSEISEVVARMTGAEAAAVVHCTSAGITLAVASAMTGNNPSKIASLPDSSDMPNRVVIPASHVVNYGHSILTDIRLAGAMPIIAGSDRGCSADDLQEALTDTRTACLLLVSSRLVQSNSVDFLKAITIAHKRNVPAFIDGAAQDMRIPELLATGADLVLCSAQKYLAAPTAGLIIGRRSLVKACRAQEQGIGRAMKATKEAIVGVLAALEERQRLDITAWRAEQDRKVYWFMKQMSDVVGIVASEIPDPTGALFSRVYLKVEPIHKFQTASALALALRSGNPSIWVGEDSAENSLILDLVSLSQEELLQVVERILKLSKQSHQA